MTPKEYKEQSSAAGVLPTGHGCVEAAMCWFVHIFGKSMERNKVTLLFICFVSIYIVKKQWGRCKEDIVKKGQE